MNRHAPLPPASLLDEGQEFIQVDFGTLDYGASAWAILDGGQFGEVVCVVIVDDKGRDLLCIEAADLSTLCRRGLDSVCRNHVVRNMGEHRTQVAA